MKIASDAASPPASIPLFQLFFDLKRIAVYPFFVHRGKTTTNAFQIPLTQLPSIPRSSDIFPFSNVSKYVLLHLERAEYYHLMHRHSSVTHDQIKEFITIKNNFKTVFTLFFTTIDYNIYNIIVQTMKEKVRLQY